MASCSDSSSCACVIIADAWKGTAELCSCWRFAWLYETKKKIIHVCLFILCSFMMERWALYWFSSQHVGHRVRIDKRTTLRCYRPTSMQFVQHTRYLKICLSIPFISTITYSFSPWSSVMASIISKWYSRTSICVLLYIRTFDLCTFFKRITLFTYSNSIYLLRFTYSNSIYVLRIR